MPNDAQLRHPADGRLVAAAADTDRSADSRKARVQRMGDPSRAVTREAKFDG